MRIFSITEIPDENISIEEILNIKEIVPIISFIHTYFIPPNICPFGIGNRVIEIILENRELIYIRLPKEMEYSHLEKYIHPLIIEIKKFENAINSKLH